MSKPPTMSADSTHQLSRAFLNTTPAYALARLYGITTDATIHRVFIDTRASISVIDSAYANSYLRHLERTTTEPLDIAGSGQLSLTSYLCTSLTFLTGNPWTPAVIAPGVLFLTDNLASKINIGNDILVNAGAFIDLAANTMTFAHRAGVKLIRT